jgi:hypothetical protein
LGLHAQGPGRNALAKSTKSRKLPVVFVAAWLNDPTLLLWLLSVWVTVDFASSESADQNVVAETRVVICLTGFPSS